MVLIMLDEGGIGVEDRASKLLKHFVQAGRRSNARRVRLPAHFVLVLFANERTSDRSHTRSWDMLDPDVLVTAETF
jgi:hypothetical protein